GGDGVDHVPDVLDAAGDHFADVGAHGLALGLDVADDLEGRADTLGAFFLVRALLGRISVRVRVDGGLVGSRARGVISGRGEDGGDRGGGRRGEGGHGGGQAGGEHPLQGDVGALADPV